MPRIEKAEQCLNCGHPTGSANFCSNCGQLNNAHKPNLAELIREAFENLFAFDTRFYHTLWPLLSKPGKVTEEFVKGRRVHYVLPIRLFILLTFFLLAAISCDNRISERAWYEVDRPQPEGTSPFGDFTLPVANLDSLNENQISPTEKAQLDSLLQTGQLVKDESGEYRFSPGIWADSSSDTFNLGWDKAGAMYRHARAHPQQSVDDALVDLNLPPTFWNHLIYSNALKISFMSANEFFSYIGRHLLIIFLLFIPVMAFLLKGLYFYKGIYYVDHFIFALHVQSAVFAYFILATILSWIIGGWIIYVAVLGTMLYVWLAMKRFYKQGFLLTTFKYFTMNFILVFVSIIFLILVATVSVLLY